MEKRIIEIPDGWRLRGVELKRSTEHGEYLAREVHYVDDEGKLDVYFTATRFYDAEHNNESIGFPRDLNEAVDLCNADLKERRCATSSLAAIGPVNVDADGAPVEVSL